MELRASITDCQRMVGEMATLSARKEGFARQDRLRDSALKLRTAMVWATKRAMKMDMLVNDIRATLTDTTRLQQQIWPAINELRAWVLDISPIARAWEETPRVAADIRITDIESLHRLVSIRFSDFDPSIYQPGPTVAVSEPQADGAA